MQSAVRAVNHALSSSKFFVDLAVSGTRQARRLEGLRLEHRPHPAEPRRREDHDAGSAPKQRGLPAEGVRSAFQNRRKNTAASL